MLTPEDFTNAVIIDTETTGLGGGDQVVEIAVITHTGQVLINTLVMPTVPINPEAQAIHGITVDELARTAAPGFHEIWEDLLAAIIGRYVIMYGATFDTRLLKQSAEAQHRNADLLTRAPRAITCAMTEYAEYWGDWNNYYRSYTFQKLTNAAAQQDIPWPTGLQPHRALADAEITRRLYRAMLNARNNLRGGE